MVILSEKTTDLMWSLTWVLIFVSVCRVQGTAISNLSGNITAIVGYPLTLSWTHSFLDSDIDLCFYQSKTKYLDEFVGWSNRNRERLNISESHHGWDFINEKMPCQDGIRREVTEPRNARQYKIYVTTIDGQRHEGQWINVNLVSGSELLYTFTINEKEVTQNIAHQSALPTLKIEDHGLTSLSILLDKEFPRSNITLSAHFENRSDVEMLQFCPMSASCSVNFTSETDLVQISVDIESGIQGFELVRVLQPVLVLDQSPIVAATVGDKKWKIALIVVLVMIPLIGGIIGLLYFLKFKKKNIRKEENHSLFETELGETKSKLTVLERELGETESKHAVETSQKNHLLAESKDLLEQNQKLTESIEVLSQNLKTSEEASKETQQKLNRLNHDYHKLQDELEKQMKVCANLQGTLYSAHDTKDEDDKMIHSLQEQILILKSDLAARKQDYDKLYMDNEGNKKHIGRLKEDLEVKQQTTEQLHETINSLKKEKQKLQNDVITLSAKQKSSKGKPPYTNINPRIPNEPLVHKNPAFGQPDSTDVMPDSVQQTGIISGQKDDHQSIETGQDALTIKGPLKDHVLDEKLGDPSGDVATTQPNIPHGTVDVSRRNEPTLRVVKQTGDICVQKDISMLLSVVVEENHQVKATWYHGNYEIWRKQKYKTGSDGNMHYLLVHHTAKGDSGDYTCHLKAEGSTLEANCVTHVKIKDIVDLKFVIKPTDVSCKIGSPVSIKASMKHQASVDFIWLHDGIVVPGDPSS